MISRHYIFACQVCHGNGTGDKEYWNGVVIITSLFKPSAEDLIKACRCLGVKKLSPYIDRLIDHDDIQILVLNKH